MNYSSFNELVGRRLEKLRTAAQRSREDVAQAARDVGFIWDQFLVRKIEKGTRPIRGEELIWLPVILHEAGIPTMAVDEMLFGAGEGLRLVNMEVDAGFDAESAKKLLSGWSESGAQKAIDRALKRLDVSIDKTRRETRALQAEIDSVTVQRVADELGWRTDQVSKRALDLWGVPFLKERNQRAYRRAADERTHGIESTLKRTTAIKRHLTDALIDELRRANDPGKRLRKANTRISAKGTNKRKRKD